MPADGSGYSVRDGDDAPATRTRDGKPVLLVDGTDYPATADALAVLLRTVPTLFDRGAVVRVERDAQRGGSVAVELSAAGVWREAHRVCRPVKRREKRDGGFEEVPCNLPEKVAGLYLDMRGEAGLRPLDGITSAPLLTAGGGIRTVAGYDPETRLWCEAVPKVAVHTKPSRAQAEGALLRLRRAFRTFPFADAERIIEDGLPTPVVNVGRPAKVDESSFLAALLTAVCRASLHLAPGVILRAPSYSGAGTGKGLLARSMCAVAFGTSPNAMTAGDTPEELDKRLTAVLLGAAPVVFLDNVNAMALRSATLASAMTERPAHVRALGRSRLLPLNSAAFIIITGNAVTLSEDLARRFMVVELDAGMEDPETRAFAPGFLASVREGRADLLAAALTVWRWGQQQGSALRAGPALGSFETWCRWVRDPLVALGCADPVTRIADVKAADPRRQAVAELFHMWWGHHADLPMTAGTLADPVREVADPAGKGRQYLAARLKNLAGTRAAGFVLVAVAPTGRWGATTYALRQTAAPSADPTTPMTPMVSQPSDGGDAAGRVGAAPMVPTTPMLSGQIAGEHTPDSGCARPMPPKTPMVFGENAPGCDPLTCYACRGTRWWREAELPDARLRCGTCHPPVPGRDVTWHPTHPIAPGIASASPAASRGPATPPRA